MQDALMATYNWMSTTPDIDSLNICELTLPGTHNAGSDWRATYPLLALHVTGWRVSTILFTRN